MKFKGDAKGFAEFDRLLKELPRTVENKVLREATRDTLKEVVLMGMKESAPRHADERSPASKKYGTLKSNIRVASVKKKRKNVQGAAIHTGRAFWGFILEKGSRYIAAMPWFLPFFKSKQAAMTQTLGEKIGKGIEDAASSYRGGRG